MHAQRPRCEKTCCGEPSQAPLAAPTVLPPAPLHPPHPRPLRLPSPLPPGGMAAPPVPSPSRPALCRRAAPPPTCVSR